ncbi:hypothetical protein As57867_005227, partial [Aphanomyces stellatus]
QYDTVRPFSLVRNFYKGQTVTAWAGPGIGKVTNLPAQDWRSYLNTAPHPDYPSASSCFCAAQMEAMRLFYKTDNFGYSYQWMAGSSTVEPGLTPKTTLTLGPWPTFTAFENDCALSRVQAGVHFREAAQAGQVLCRPIADAAYNKLTQLLQGANE